VNPIARFISGAVGNGEGPEIVPISGWSAPLTTLIAAAMGFLAVLTLAAGMAANRLAAEWRSDLAGVATVRITGAPDEMEQKVKTVLDVLRTTPGIAEVRVLGPDDQAELLRPWLGSDINVGDLPLPQLIDVALDGAGPNAKALQDRLALTLDGVIYDDHAAWRAPLAATAGSLERLAFGASILVLLAAGAMVALAARTTMAANRQVIETVRLIGAEDRFIANAFVRRLVSRAATGAFLGAVLASAALWFLPAIEADSGLGVTLSPDRMGWVLLIFGVPAISGFIAWISARMTARAELNRLP
jgi:cell division transport system permease protein